MDHRQEICCEYFWESEKSISKVKMKLTEKFGLIRKKIDPDPRTKSHDNTNDGVSN